MEDDNRTLIRLKVLGLRKIPNEGYCGFWLYGRSGERIALANFCPQDISWHIQNNPQGVVMATVDYLDTERQVIKSVDFYGPEDKIKKLVESIGFITV